MKKPLSLLALMITLISTLTMTAMATDSDITYISNADDFLFFAIDVTDNHIETAGKTWELTTNIDLRSLTGSNAYWPGIGTSDHPFLGTFNGADYTITLWTDNTTNSVDTSASTAVNYALFNYIGSTAEIKNVTVAGTVTGTGDIGGVVTYSNGGTITSCTNTATVTSSDETASVGGVVASGTATITNCTSSDGNATGDNFVTDSGTPSTTPLTRDLFTVDVTDKTYTGSAIEPTVSSATLTLTTDYSVAYTDNTAVGTATITISGEGTYSDTLEYTFSIVEDSSGNSGSTDDPLIDPTPTVTALSAGINPVIAGGSYSLSDPSVSGWSIESDSSSTGIVYSTDITFYVPEDVTLTITAIGGVA